jgi:phytoene dehydrogenase-like protein
MRARDAVVVGAGPNGLAAAIVLAQAGLDTLVVEAAATAGGGARSAELTLHGFVHDPCSSVHPLAAGGPFLRRLGLARYGLEFVDSPAPLAHVMPDGRAVLLERSLDATAARLGPDGPAYRRLFAPFVRRFDDLMDATLGPLRIPRSPLLLARFGLVGLRSMCGLARRFRGRDAPALLAGLAAHAMLPLDAPASASFALILGAAGHAVGWPLARGGSQAIADALVACLRDAGGELALGWRVARLDELPHARAYLLDLTPRQVLAIAGDRLPPGYRRRLARFRYGPGVYKMDWALRAPIPWRDPACARAATVHLAGDLADVARAEAAPHRGRVADRPFVLVVQPTLFDPTRAPRGMHVGWAYCHVPNGVAVDACAAIEAQIERHAPGFRDVVLARSTRDPLDMEGYDANYVGGDINGGLASLGQLFFRPVARVDPYATPAPDVFLCSSSTPPGGGVHGMCGWWAAQSALRRQFAGRSPARVARGLPAHAADPPRRAAAGGVQVRG